MKKYTSFLVVFTLLFVLLGFNVKSVNASGPYNDYTPGCTSIQGYSPTTGAKCAILVNTSLPQGCTSTVGYSPLTGVKCDSPTSNPALPAGCTSTVGYSPTTGVKCDSGGVVPSYPPGCTSKYGYSITTGLSCGDWPQSPVISGVNGPQSLNVNQQGTWTVSAYDSNGGNLSYSVSWGDPIYYYDAQSQSANAPAQQSATFSHSYSQVGNYTPIFTVTNTSGQSTQTSLSVNVVLTYRPGCSSTSGYSSVDGQPCDGTNTTIPTVTVTASPTTVSLGQASTISWSSTGNNLSCHLSGGLVSSSGSQTVYPTSVTNYSVTCSTPSGTTGTGSVTVYVVTAPTQTLSITTPSPLPNAKVGTNYSVVLNVSGMPGGLTTNNLNWSYDAFLNGLNGLFLSASDSGEIITGTPTVAGTYQFTLTASTGSLSVSKQFTLTVDPADVVPAYTPTISSIYPPGCSSTNSSYSSVNGEPCTNARIGDTVYVYGSGFTQNAYIQIDGASYSPVDGVSRLRIPANFISSNLVSFVAPANAGVGSHIIQVETFMVSNSVSLNFVGVTTTTVPTISYLSPSSGVVDSTFTINGNGFTLTGNAVNFGFGYIPNLTSASGNQITFTVPESLDLRCRFSNPPCMTMTAMTQPGNYNVSVSNMNGTSNILNFTVVGNVLGATAFHFTQLLQLGSNGNEVMELQKFLNNAKYYTDVIDGNFGAKTENAVVQFQVTNGLVGDGVVGALTRAVLNR